MICTTHDTIPDRIAKFFAIAALTSQNSTYDPHRMGAVIIDNNRVISKGWNSYKTHPMAVKYQSRKTRICLHAELHALIKCQWNSDGLDMIVARVRRDGELGSSCPCAGCYNALLEAKIRNVWYIDKNNKFVCEPIIEDNLWSHKS